MTLGELFSGRAS